MRKILLPFLCLFMVFSGGAVHAQQTTNMGNKRLINVLDGVGGHDAATVEQLPAFGTNSVALTRIA